MKTIFANFKILLAFLAFLSFQNCTDKELISNGKQDFKSGYFAAYLIGASSNQWNAAYCSAIISNDICVKASQSYSEYMEFHIPLSATKYSSFTDLDYATFIYYSSYYGYLFDASNCTGNLDIYISDKTDSYIQGTFSAKVLNSDCTGFYTISSGFFEIYF